MFFSPNILDSEKHQMKLIVAFSISILTPVVIYKGNANLMLCSSTFDSSSQFWQSNLFNYLSVYSPQKMFYLPPSLPLLSEMKKVKLMISGFIFFSPNIHHYAIIEDQGVLFCFCFLFVCLRDLEAILFVYSHPFIFWGVTINEGTQHKSLKPWMVNDFRKLLLIFLCISLP